MLTTPYVYPGSSPVWTQLLRLCPGYICRRFLPFSRVTLWQVAEIISRHYNSTTVQHYTAGPTQLRRFSLSVLAPLYWVEADVKAGLVYQYSLSCGLDSCVVCSILNYLFKQLFIYLFAYIYIYWKEFMINTILMQSHVTDSASLQVWSNCPPLAQTDRKSGWYTPLLQNPLKNIPCFYNCTE